MIKRTLLALILLGTLSEQSQARPQIWKVLEEVAIASVMPPPVYYVEQPRYHYREPRVVYYNQPSRISRESRYTIVYDRHGNQYLQPRY